MRNLKKFESFVTEEVRPLEVDRQPSSKSVSHSPYLTREDVIEYLSNEQDVYTMEDLEAMDIDQLKDLLDQVNNAEEEERVSEAKEWIRDAVRKPGSLRRKLRKGKGEKISISELDSELKALKAKDKNKRKPGLQLSKRDRTKHKELVLAKTLKGLRK